MMSHCEMVTLDHPVDTFSALVRNKNLSYYAFLDEDEGDEVEDESSWRVVHMRYWHLNHAVEDTHLGDRIEVPPGCSESMESCLRVKLPEKKAKELLKQFGFTVIEPIDHEENMMFRVGKPHYVQLIAPRQDVLDLYKKEVKDYEGVDFASVDKLVEAHTTWGHKNNIHVELVTKTGVNLYMAAIPRPLWYSLPPFPETRR